MRAEFTNWEYSKYRLPSDIFKGKTSSKGRLDNDWGTEWFNISTM